MTGKEIDALELGFEAAKSHFYTISHQAEVIAQLAVKKADFDELLDILLTRDVNMMGAGGQVDAIGNKAIEEHVQTANSGLDEQIKKIAKLHELSLEAAYKEVLAAEKPYAAALATSSAMAQKAKKLEQDMKKVSETYSHGDAAMTAIEGAEPGEE